MNSLERPELDDYAVLAAVGAGGMATVYKVRYERLGSVRALKVLSNPNAEVARRLRLEGRVQAQLKHPNVVHVYDVVEVEGQPGLVMEYVDGPTLKQLVSGDPLPIDEVVRLGTGILRGMAAAHAAGVLHRDLKPGNVLLERVGGDLVPKVTDFGLAKVLQDAALDALDPTASHTPSGAVIGTWRYMAPEQVHRVQTDTRTDVWALGVVLYELATGRPAFDASSLVTITSRIAQADHVDIARVRPDLPTAVVETVRAALQVDPVDRPTDAAGLLALWEGAEEARYSASTLRRASEPPSARGEASTATFLPSGADGTAELVLAPAEPSTLLQPRWRSVSAGVGVLALAGALSTWWMAGPPPPPVVITWALDGADQALPVLGREFGDGVEVRVGDSRDAVADLREADGPRVAFVPRGALDTPDGLVTVGEVVRAGWVSRDGAWLVTPTEASREALRTLCVAQGRRVPEVVRTWLGGDIDIVVAPSDSDGCDAWVSGHHADLDALRTRLPSWCIARLEGPAGIHVLGPAAHDASLDEVRDAIGRLPPGLLGDDVLSIRRAVGPPRLYAPQLHSERGCAAQAEAEPPPVEPAPAPPPQQAGRPAMVWFRTWGGVEDAGWLAVDDGPLHPSGGPDPIVVPAGVHELRFFKADRKTVAYQETSSLAPGEELRLCVDLSRGVRCQP